MSEMELLQKIADTGDYIFMLVLISFMVILFK